MVNDIKNHLPSNYGLYEFYLFVLVFKFNNNTILARQPTSLIHTKKININNYGTMQYKNH